MDVSIGVGGVIPYPRLNIVVVMPRQNPVNTLIISGPLAADLKDLNYLAQKFLVNLSTQTDQPLGLDQPH